MKIETDKIKTILACTLLFALSACQTIALKENAKSVRLHFTADPIKDCSFRATLVGSEGHWYNSWLIANDVLTHAALNDLSNQAVDLGADTVFIPLYANQFKTSVTIIGQAFLCNKSPTQPTSH